LFHVPATSFFCAQEPDNRRQQQNAPIGRQAGGMVSGKKEINAKADFDGDKIGESRGLALFRMDRPETRSETKPDEGKSELHGFRVSSFVA
jgi:hypothetical protein